MARIDSARGNPKRKKNSAARRATARANAVRKSDVAPMEEAAPLAPPVGRLERTRRLILAALRVWELKRKIRD
jgi:hypothetical protein